MASTTYEILNTKASNTFLHETNWRLVDPLTGAVSNVSVVPASYDTLQIYRASLILSVNFDMTFLQHIVLDFGEPRSGISFSLRVKRDCEWLLHTTASILVRSGDLIADIDQTGCINTGIRIGGEYKLMADNCTEAVVRSFTFASSVTPVTVTIRQEGFISGTLPVVLDDFRALEKQDEVHLSWRTLQESNSSYFLVERSMDAKQFKALAQIPAAGQSSIEKTYSFIDRQAPKGILYYRLRTVSVDESEVVSVIRSVRFSPEFHAMRVFPNPVQRQATLRIASNDSKPLRWQLFHSGGQLIASRQITVHSGNMELDFGDIKNGYYFLIIHREDGSRLRAGITVAH